MGLKTYSAFTYGHTITDDNKYIDFNEGAGELTAIVELGSFTLGSFLNAVSVALNNAGTQDYSVSVDRNTRFVTISAPLSFDLLPITGLNSAVSAYPLIGFSSDISGLSNEGDLSSGSFFEPQNILQKYTDYQDNVKTLNATKRQTPSGVVEVVSYGTVNFMECNITPITDIVPMLAIKSNANAVSDYRNFMLYCITKAPLEFIVDIDSPNSIQETLLESTQESKDGVNFKIKELISKKLFGYFESGTLTFRGL